MYKGSFRYFRPFQKVYFLEQMAACAARPPYHCGYRADMPYNRWHAGRVPLPLYLRY